MTAAAFIPLVGSVCNALLALLVYFGNPRHQLNRIYTLLGLCIAAWNLGQFHLFIATSREEAAFWMHFEWVAIIFGPVLLYHLSLIMAERRTRPWQIVVPYVVCAGFAVLSLTPLMIADIRQLGASGWYATAGPAMHVFHPFFMVLVLLSIHVLVARRRVSGRLMRRKLDALIAAQCLLLFSGVNDVLPVMGIDHYPFTNIPVYPYGSVAAVFYGLIIGYSVLQNDLLNVHVALGRLAAQIVRFVFFVVIGTSLLLVASLVFPEEFGAVAFLLALLALLGAGLVSALLFPRLFGGGAEELEKSLLGDRFEYHDKVRAFTESLSGYPGRDVLLADLADMLESTLGVEAVRLYIESGRADHYELVLCRPQTGAPRPTMDAGALPLGMFSGAAPGGFHVDSIWGGGVSDEAARLRESLRGMGMRLCLALMVGGRAFGALLLGGKRGGTPYTATDLALLESLAERLALILNQFRLTGQIVRSQEMELLGRMSKGIAHDMNNLLTPISTLLQLLEEGSEASDIAELVPPARRNIEAARAYILNSLFLSQKNEPDLQPGDLGEAIQSAVALMRPQADAVGVPVRVRIPCSLGALLDEAMIVRVFSNLLANAIDASEPGGGIEIEGAPFRPPGRARRSLRVVVADRGSGIPPKVLAQIGKAYVTTKDTGDERRGFGLGLPICKKIIEIHGGTFKIESKVGAGTRIVMDIPEHVIQPVHGNNEASNATQDA